MSMKAASQESIALLAEVRAESPEISMINQYLADGADINHQFVDGYTPLMFAVEGMVFGVSVACLFAPREFLTGPVGQKWMRLIGTESIVAARIVCLLITLLFSGFIALVAWGAWSDLQRPGQPLF